MKIKKLKSTEKKDRKTEESNGERERERRKRELDPQREEVMPYSQGSFLRLPSHISTIKSRYLLYVSLSPDGLPPWPLSADCYCIYWPSSSTVNSKHRPGQPILLIPDNNNKNIMKIFSSPPCHHTRESTEPKEHSLQVTLFKISLLCPLPLATLNYLKVLFGEVPSFRMRKWGV